MLGNTIVCWEIRHKQKIVLNQFNIIGILFYVDFIKYSSKLNVSIFSNFKKIIDISQLSEK